MSNLKKYDDVFVKSFSIDKKALLKNPKYDSLKKWDSVGHMAMIAKLEDKFKIAMEMDDIIDFSSYKVGKEILKKYKIKF